MLKRFQSPVVWATLAALVAFITKEWLGFDIPKFDVFVELLLACLIAFGIVNNPTDKTKF
jgi:uncharacterized membrane protein